MSEDDADVLAEVLDAAEFTPGGGDPAGGEPSPSRPLRSDARSAERLDVLLPLAVVVVLASAVVVVLSAVLVELAELPVDCRFTRNDCRSAISFDAEAASEEEVELPVLVLSDVASGGAP